MFGHEQIGVDGPMNELSIQDSALVPAADFLPFQANVLLVEDDKRIAQEIVSYLTPRGFHVAHASDGAQGLVMALSGSFDVIVTDRMLPGLDGLMLIDQVRDHGARIPILVLSAIGDPHERVRGLRAGGDDYLSKPFDLEELAARIEALLRRPLERRETVIRVGPLVMDLLERSVQRAGRAIELLPREFKMLEYMMRRPNQTLTRAMLLRDVWHYRYAPETNLVDVHVGKLRRKLTVDGETEVILTVRGTGFMLVGDLHVD